MFKANNVLKIVGLGLSFCNPIIYRESKLSEFRIPLKINNTVILFIKTPTEFQLMIILLMWRTLVKKILYLMGLYFSRLNKIFIRNLDQ
jgi:hypothetical protein